MSAALRAVPADPSRRTLGATGRAGPIAVASLPGANSPPSTATSAEPADSDTEAQEPNRRILRMLTGTHTGAESELHSDRLLIGNLESECDVVVDVSRPERHICLVRASSDGWTVLSIAGDLWVGDEFIEPQHTRDIASGIVLTLGRVAFCIANTADVNWSKVKAPLHLTKPEPAGPVPITALPPSGAAKLHKWHAAKLACGIGIAALTLSSAGAYLTHAWTLRTPTAEEGVARIKAHQNYVKALPFGKELQVHATPEVGAPNRELVMGYLPKREQVRELEHSLRNAEIQADVRVTAVDELTTELTRRFSRVKATDVTYQEAGHFSVDTESSTISLHDRQARQTLQEVPLVSGLSLSVKDMLDAAGKPIVVRYQRSADHPGDITVTELDVIRQRQNFIVKEMRLGTVPSIVLDNGIRYFEGAVLPDGDVLKRIGATELVVTRGRGERIIPLKAEDATTDSPAAASPSAGAPAPAPGSAQTAAQSAATSAFSSALSSAVAPKEAAAAGTPSRP